MAPSLPVFHDRLTGSMTWSCGEGIASTDCTFPVDATGCRVTGRQECTLRVDVIGCPLTDRQECPLLVDPTGCPVMACHECPFPVDVTGCCITGPKECPLPEEDTGCPLTGPNEFPLPVEDTGCPLTDRQECALPADDTERPLTGPQEFPLAVEVTGCPVTGRQEWLIRVSWIWPTRIGAGSVAEDSMGLPITCCIPGPVPEYVKWPPMATGGRCPVRGGAESKESNSLNSFSFLTDVGGPSCSSLAKPSSINTPEHKTQNNVKKKSVIFVWIMHPFVTSLLRKGLFTPSEYGTESDKDQTTSKTDQRINDKHQRKFSLSLRVNGALIYTCVENVSMTIFQNLNHNHLDSITELGGGGLTRSCLV